MAETVRVPIEGQHVTGQPGQQPAQEQPTWARRSLHNVKLGQTLAARQAEQAETAPQWVENRYGGQGGRFEFQPVVRPAEPEASPSPQYAQPYQQQVNYMEDQPGGQQPQQQHLPQAPDPLSYDFYDPAETARFHADNSAYMQSQIDARVQSHLAPHMGALQEAELRREYNSAVERYGDDANFQQVMDTALRQCEESAKAGKRFSIIEAYQAANDATAARPGVRGNAHLPEAFSGRGKKIGRISLRDIVIHNQKTGRAR